MNNKTLSDGERKSLKERITMIAHKSRMIVAVLVSVILIIVIVVGVAFVGISQKNQPLLTEYNIFPTSGKNVSDLDTDLIITNISKAKNLKEKNEIFTYETSGLFTELDKDFNWDFYGFPALINICYNRNQKTYYSHVSINNDTNLYYIAEYEEQIHEYPVFEGYREAEYQEIHKLRNFINALKYLPKEEIKKLAPKADGYIIELNSDLIPNDNEHIITYNQDCVTNVTELDDWKIHLIIKPTQQDEEDNEQAEDSEDKIHLFYYLE